MLSSKKNRVENVTALLNYINDSETIVKWNDFIQFAFDYNMYKELYLNHFIFQKVIDEHNEAIIKGTWVKSS